MAIKITNGLVVDGKNSQPFVGDVVVEGNTIISITSKNNLIENQDHEYDEIIDADGLIVSPGFIDIHTHSDVSNFAFKTDITIFDKELIKDNSTYLSAANKPSGIKYVIVNGKVMVSDNQLKLEKSGEELRP